MYFGKNALVCKILKAVWPLEIKWICFFDAGKSLIGFLHERVYCEWHWFDAHEQVL